MTLQDAIREMWARMQPLEARGFHPISEVEIVDASKKKVIQVFQLTDPEFKEHLESDERDSRMAHREPGRVKSPPHAPEKKGHYTYVARIRLEL